MTVNSDIGGDDERRYEQNWYDELRTNKGRILMATFEWLLSIGNLLVISWLASYTGIQNACYYENPHDNEGACCRDLSESAYCVEGAFVMSRKMLNDVIVRNHFCNCTDGCGWACSETYAIEKGGHQPTFLAAKILMIVTLILFCIREIIYLCLVLTILSCTEASEDIRFSFASVWSILVLIKKPQVWMARATKVKRSGCDLIVNSFFGDIWLTATASVLLFLSDVAEEIDQSVVPILVFCCPVISTLYSLWYSCYVPKK